MPVIEIKYEPVIDISHWIDVDDFNAINPKPWMIIAKATQGTSFLDSEWALDCDRIREAGIRLGSFHFIDLSNEIYQADWYSEIVLETGHRSNEPLCCDMEIRGFSLDRIRRFNDRVQYRTGSRPIIYSTELLLEEIFPNGVAPAWIRDEWLWIAEYPNNPNGINQIPTWIVPNGCSINKIALWQYTDDLVFEGIPGNNVDGNLISRPYFEYLQLTEPGTITDPMPENKMKYKVIWDAGVNKRLRPTISSTAVGVYSDNQIVEVIKDNIKDETYPNDPNKLWVEFPDHTFSASIYGAGSVRMVKIDETQPPQSLPPKSVIVTDKDNIKWQATVFTKIE